MELTTKTLPITMNFTLEQLIKICENTENINIIDIIVNNLDKIPNICWNERNEINEILNKQLVKICENPNEENLNIIVNNVERLTHDCWVKLCDNPNINIIEIINKKKYRHLGFSTNGLSQEYFEILCSRENTTEIVDRHLESAFINVSYDGCSEDIRNDANEQCAELLGILCKTKNNLCIVEKHLDKLQNKQWQILFNNEHAIDIIKKKIEITTDLFKILMGNHNPEARQLVDDFVTKIKV